MDLSVIIPAYNEAERIGSTIRSIDSYLSKKKWKYEIIVVDDGSNDDTVGVAKAAGSDKVRVVSLGGNRGKGFAVWKGLTLARFGYALFTDADMSTPIEDIEKLAPFIGSYDVIIGSRNLSDSKITKKQPWLRSRLGKTFPLLVRALVLPGIKDTQCGFKLFTRRAIDAITPYQTIFDFGFDVEILFLAGRMGLAIKEVGVTWANAEGSKVHPIRDSRRMLLDLIKIRANQLNGNYNQNQQSG
ncbi:MAG: dolichyl-phosphate beta-glucosyltransferase [Nanoarchaeota archaeon]